MNSRRPKRLQPENENKMYRSILFIVSCSILAIIYLVAAYEPLTKEQHVERFNKMNEEVEPFRKNLTDCARQVKASAIDVENFLKRVPQSTLQGKCFVACILKRNLIINKNKIDEDVLLQANKAVYGEDSEVLTRLRAAINECKDVVEGIFEVCELSSLFNDCMHMKMEHLLDKLTMERRMRALGQLSEVDDWEEDDETLQLMRDEL